MAKHRLDSLDFKILRMLCDNARKPFLEIARETGVSGAAIHQRIQRLSALDVIRGYECVVNPAKVGCLTCALVGFILDNPADLDRITESLRAVPEVVECHYTTGKYDLIAKVNARDNDHLFTIIRERIQSLDFGRTETFVSFQQAFHRQAPIFKDVD